MARIAAVVALIAVITAGLAHSDGSAGLVVGDEDVLRSWVTTLTFSAGVRRLCHPITAGGEDEMARRIPFVAVIAASLVLAVPSASAQGCSSTCSVGAVGTGGESSDGRANGFRRAAPSTGFPGSTFTNQGNQIAGHITVEGPTFNGSASGAITPQGDLVGHYEGVSADFFGVPDPCSGICG